MKKLVRNSEYSRSDNVKKFSVLAQILFLIKKYVYQGNLMVIFGLFVRFLEGAFLGSSLLNPEKRGRF